VRPRALAVHHKTVAKLVSLMKEAEADGMYRVARRIHAVLLNSDGLTSGDIASTLMVGRSRISEWLRSYEGSGLDGLLEGQRSGRPPQLTAEQRIPGAHSGDTDRISVANSAASLGAPALHASILAAQRPGSIPNRGR
jgi:hypothetical protein